ncbi:MAG: hypothetical protein IKY00_05935, partial [Clostridia bacterium]|nr:hypothetical protein [Clostridia bacterium]
MTGIVYHYTTGSAIPQILNIEDKKIHLWFTRYDCLNDSSEGNELSNVISAVAEQYYNEKRISKLLWNKIINKYEESKAGAVFFVKEDINSEGYPILRTLPTKYDACI